jgi:hypothetical protein
MKITINKTIETELEVPQYWTNPNSDGVYKLLPDGRCLCALPFEKSPLISISSVSFNYKDDSLEITEQVFNLRLNETKQYLNL